MAQWYDWIHIHIQTCINLSIYLSIMPNPCWGPRRQAASSCRNISKAKHKEGGGGVVTNIQRLKISDDTC